MEWKEYKLRDVITVKYGKDHKQLAEGEIPIYGSGGIMRFGNKYLYDGPSILIPRKGSLNNIMYSDKPFWTVDTMFWTIINEDIVNPQFLYYSIYKKDFASLNVGSAVPSLTVPVIEDITVNLPPREIQDKIVSILKSLDDKIENNRKINENLEQQAQALFKSWFVDFEPFRDQPFVESELGMIPEGWRVGTISEFGTIICGKTPSKAIPEYYGGKVPFIKIPEMHGSIFPLKHEEFISSKGVESQPNKLIPPFSLMVSCIATVGLVSINTVPSFTNQQINSIVVSNANSLYYLYLLLSGMTDELQNLGRGGTATLNVNTKTFSNIKVVIPSNDCLDKFHGYVFPMFTEILNNTRENLRLAQLRDTLLPKLMSGEINLDNI